MTIQKNTRIYQLPIQVQQEIKNDIIKALETYEEEDFNLVDEALNGRLCDIEDLIDINVYCN